MRISDWSSDVCSSDLERTARRSTRLLWARDQCWTQHSRQYLRPGLRAADAESGHRRDADTGAAGRALSETGQYPDAAGRPARAERQERGRAQYLSASAAVLSTLDRKSTRLNSSH